MTSLDATYILNSNILEIDLISPFKFLSIGHSKVDTIIQAHGEVNSSALILNSFVRNIQDFSTLGRFSCDHGNITKVSTFHRLSLFY